MSKFWIGNLYLFFAVLCTAASQVTLKALLNEVGVLTPHWSFIQHVSVGGRIGQLIAILVLVVAGPIFWVMSLTKLDLSYAYSLACGSAVIVALLSVIFLGEAVSARMWVGIVLIVAGAIFLVSAYPPSSWKD